MDIIVLAIPVISIKVTIEIREVAFTIKISSLPYAGSACLTVMGNVIKRNVFTCDKPSAPEASIWFLETDNIHNVRAKVVLSRVNPGGGEMPPPPSEKCMVKIMLPFS